MKGNRGCVRPEPNFGDEGGDGVVVTNARRGKEARRPMRLWTAALDFQDERR